MDKQVLLHNLQTLIETKSYNPLAILDLLRKATHEEFYTKDIYRTLMKITNDEAFSNKIVKIYDTFYRGTPLFEEYMLKTISAAMA